VTLALAGSLTLGVPVWKQTTSWVLSIGATLLLGAGIALAVDFGAPTTLPVVESGLPCLILGSAVSVAALLGATTLTWRLWRRLAVNTSWLVAIGASATGLAMLNISWVCTGGDALHVFGFHAPVVLLLALLAGAVVPMTLEMRSQL
jgi:hypothetical protein